MIELVPIAKTAAQFEFALEVKRLAFGPYIAELWGWDEQRQRASLAERWLSREPKEIRLNREPVGILTTNIRPDGVEIEDFYILPTYQHRGIGTEILGAVLLGAKTDGGVVHVKCLRWNPARDWYARNGFVVTFEDETHLHMENRQCAG